MTQNLRRNPLHILYNQENDKLKKPFNYNYLLLVKIWQ